VTRIWLVCVLLVLVVLVLGSSDASAQTHPCDDLSVPPPTVLVGSPAGVAFCIIPADAQGNPTTLTSFRVTLDGIEVFKGPLTPIGAVSSTGFNYYETPKNLALAKGSHTIVVYPSSADGEGLGSLPFVFQVKGVPPGQAVIKKIVR
jgi:hypothetical protein